MECISKVSNNIIKIVKIRAYKYQELDSKGKAKVIYQMNEIPFDSEFENDNGELITEYDLTQSEVDKLLKFNQVSGDTVILEE